MDLNGWLIALIILLLGLGGFFHYFAAYRSGVPETLNKDHTSKDTFWGSLAYVLFPVMMSWCKFRHWHYLSGFSHFFGWFFFIFFIIIFFGKLIHVVRLFWKGYPLEGLMKLLSIAMIYAGVVLCAGVLGTIIIVGFIIVSLLTPSGSSRGGGGSSGGGSHSPSSPDWTSGNAGDRVYHDGATWEHDGSWGDPWKRV